jgi:hypothetical protein
MIRLNIKTILQDKLFRGVSLMYQNEVEREVIHWLCAIVKLENK